MSDSKYNFQTFPDLEELIFPPVATLAFGHTTYSFIILEVTVGVGEGGGIEDLKKKSLNRVKKLLVVMKKSPTLPEKGNK